MTPPYPYAIGERLPYGVDEIAAMQFNPLDDLAHLFVG
jgi:hypothetical protein